MTTTRSPSGMKHESALSIDVLPLPVPPAIMMFSLETTIACERRARPSPVSEPKPTSRSTVSVSLKKRRIETCGPSGATGGITASMREPSGKPPFEDGVRLVDVLADVLRQVPQRGDERLAARELRAGRARAGPRRST